MTIRTTRWPAGVPCWADLTAPDTAAAKAFYSDVIGWDFQDTEADYGGYAIATVGEAAAAGVGPAQAGAPRPGPCTSPATTPTRRPRPVTGNGGTVIVAPGDVGPLGRMFIAADPTGAAFGVWQAGTHIGAGIANEPGGLAWDLRSPDPDAARLLRGRVRLHLPGARGRRRRLRHLPPAGRRGAARRHGRHDGRRAPRPTGSCTSRWTTPAPVAATEGGGGTVAAPAFDTPYGRMAGLTDPAGAVFWVTQPAADQPQPER